MSPRCLIPGEELSTILTISFRRNALLQVSVVELLLGAGAAAAVPSNSSSEREQQWSTLIAITHLSLTAEIILL